MRDRAALIRFDRAYTDAQANRRAFLSRTGGGEVSAKESKATRKIKRKPSNRPVRRRKKLATMVLDRIVDMMFPDIIPGLANLIPREV